MQLCDPIGSRRDDLPCFAIVHRLSCKGCRNVLSFGAADEDNGAKILMTKKQEPGSSI
jgi:hypothetical protein